MNTSSRISLEATQTILTEARLIPTLRALRDAVGTYARDIFPAYAPAVSEATRGSLISDLFYVNAQTNLAEDRGFLYDEVRGQRYVKFDDRILYRVKHLNRDLASRNYPTRQARGFLRQGLLDGFPECHRLQLGYRLDITGLSLRDAFIVMPIGRKDRFNVWVWQIWGDEIEESSIYKQWELDLLQGEGSRRFAYDDYSKRMG